MNRIRSSAAAAEERDGEKKREGKIERERGKVKGIGAGQARERGTEAAGAVEDGDGEKVSEKGDERRPKGQDACWNKCMPPRAQKAYFVCVRLTLNKN